MNILHAIMTTTLLTPGLQADTSGQSAAAMMTSATLDVATLGGSVESLGNNRYRSRFIGTGTLSNGVIVESTTHELICTVDDNTDILDCTGTLKVGGVSAPIRLNWTAGQVRYALRSGFSARHVAAWELWMTQELIDLLPPTGGDDGGDDGDGDGGGGGGWDFPGEIVVGEIWTTRDWFSDDWTVILDGAVVSGLWW